MGTESGDTEWRDTWGEYNVDGYEILWRNFIVNFNNNTSEGKDSVAILFAEL